MDVDISTSSPPENPRVNSLKIIKSRHVLPAPNRTLNRPNHVMILYYWHGISRRLPLCDHHHHRPQIMAWLINKQYLQQPEPLIWAIILAPRLKKKRKKKSRRKVKKKDPHPNQNTSQFSSIFSRTWPIGHNQTDISTRAFRSIFYVC